MTELHELVTALAAPWVVLSPRSGQLTGSGAEGVYARDRRILSRLASPSTAGSRSRCTPSSDPRRLISTSRWSKDSATPATIRP